MRKYLVVFRAKFQQAVLYRAEVLLWLVLDTVPLLVLGPFWMAVYRTRSKVAGFSLAMMITYYLLGRVVGAIVTHHFDQYWEKEIRNGTIARFLVKPISFMAYVLFDSISSRLVRLVLFVPVIAGAIAIFSNYIVRAEVNLLVLLPFIVIAYLVDFFLVYLITISTFWFYDSTSLSHGKWLVGGILAGEMVPLAVLPGAVQVLAAWLPFRFLVSVPIEVYLGRVKPESVMGLILSGIFWVVVLARASSYFYRAGVKRFSAAGG